METSRGSSPATPQASIQLPKVASKVEPYRTPCPPHGHVEANVEVIDGRLLLRSTNHKNIELTFSTYFLERFGLNP